MEKHILKEKLEKLHCTAEKSSAYGSARPLLRAMPKKQERRHERLVVRAGCVHSSQINLDKDFAKTNDCKWNHRTQQGLSKIVSHFDESIGSAAGAANKHSLLKGNTPTVRFRSIWSLYRSYFFQSK